MLKKAVAAVLLLGLCLPYACDITPITGAWDDLATAISLGIPIIVAVAYAAHTFLPPLARFHERHGAMLHGLFRMVYFMLAGWYLADALRDTTVGTDRYAILGALAGTGALLYWQQQRGTKAARLPLLLLIISGIAVVTCFTSLLDDLQVGAWVTTAAYLVAVALEAQTLAGAERVTHGG